MKIDFLPTLPERPAAGDGGGGRDDAARTQAGEGFAAAVRGIKEKRGGGPDADAPAPRAGDTGTREADGHAAAPDEGEAAAEPKAEPRAEGDPLRAVLGLFGLDPLRAPAAPASVPGEPAGEAPAEGGARADAASLPGEAELAAEGSARRPLRLDVLRMETHFEPRHDVVSGAPGDGPAPATEAANAADFPALAAGAVPSADADPRSAALAAPARAPAAPLAALANEAARRPAERAPTAGEAREAASPVPLRFEEAVARLGSASAGREPGTGNGENGQGTPERAPAGAERREAATARSSFAAALPRTEASARADAASNDATGSTLAAQVAQRIGEAFGGDAVFAAPAGGGEAPRPGARFAPDADGHLRLRAGGAALRTLTLQLQPEHLGTLEVSLRLRDGQLALEIGASRPETAAALAGDEAALRQLLEKAGFSLDDGAIAITVRDAASAAAPAARSGDAPAGGGGGNTSSGNGGSGADSGPSDRGGEARRDPSGENRRAPPREDAGRGRAGGSTYL